MHNNNLLECLVLALIFSIFSFQHAIQIIQTCMPKNHVKISIYGMSNFFVKLTQTTYRLGLVNSNMVTLKFHLIQTFVKIFTTFLSFQS